jgi:para-aminobenzoate synthetase component 1
VFLALADEAHCLFLDSALEDPQLGRYAYVAADPSEYWQASINDPDPLAELQRRVSALQSTPIERIPLFQGGAAGLLSYDLGRSLERLPAPRSDLFGVPVLAMGLYDLVVSFDCRASSTSSATVGKIS